MMMVNFKMQFQKDWKKKTRKRRKKKSTQLWLMKKMVDLLGCQLNSKSSSKTQALTRPKLLSIQSKCFRCYHMPARRQLLRLK